MAAIVKWSPEAKDQLESTLNYLLENWNEQVLINLSNRLEKCITIILNYPNAFPFSDRRKGFHKCVVSKHISLFYRVHQNKIEILSLFDNRQSKQKVKHFFE